MGNQVANRSNRLRAGRPSVISAQYQPQPGFIAPLLGGDGARDIGIPGTSLPGSRDIGIPGSRDIGIPGSRDIGIPGTILPSTGRDDVGISPVRDPRLEGGGVPSFRTAVPTFIPPSIGMSTEGMFGGGSAAEEATKGVEARESKNKLRTKFRAAIPRAPVAAAATATPPKPIWRDYANKYGGNRPQTIQRFERDLAAWKKKYGKMSMA